MNCSVAVLHHWSHTFSVDVDEEGELDALTNMAASEDGFLDGT